MIVTLENSLLANLNGEIVAVDASRAEWVASCLRQVATHPRMQELASTSDDADFWFPSDDWRAQFRPYSVKNGILEIPVFGVLLNRFPWAMGNWATGYTYIQKAIERGMEDGNVNGIAFICDSPGGEVSGCFELCDKIFALRGDKPMRAFVSDRAYSACYAIASCADFISASRSSGSGSIGVVAMHVSFAGALDQAGIEVTFIKAGKWKTDGNSSEHLSSHAKERIQVRIDKTMLVFSGMVSRNRGLDQQAVLDLEADCFSSDEALANGLIDKVEVFEDALKSFSDDPNGSTGTGESDMTTATPTATVTFTQVQLDAAVLEARTAALVEGKAAGKLEGAGEGKTAERARVRAIITNDAAKGKTASALAIALDSDMTVDQAASLLATLPGGGTVTAPKAVEGDGGAPKAKKSPFELAMEANTPEVGAGPIDTAETEDDDEKVSNRLRAAHASLTGRPIAKAKAA